MRVLDPPGTAQDGTSTLAARERHAPEATILISLNHGTKIALTDSDGEFEFTSLPASEYTLQVQESSLPDYWAVTSTKEITVNLLPGGRVSRIEFVLEARPRPNRRIVIEQIVSAPQKAAPAEASAKNEPEKTTISTSAITKKPSADLVRDPEPQPKQDAQETVRKPGTP